VRLTTEGLEASRLLKKGREELAERVTGRYFERRPQWEKSCKHARQKCAEDTRHHLDYLSEALSLSRPAIFADYVVWVAALLARLNIPGEALNTHLALLRDTIADQFATAGSSLAARDITMHYVDGALAKISQAVPEVNCFLDGEGAFDILARDYLEDLLQGNRRRAGQRILAAVELGSSIHDIYLRVFQRVLHEVGRLWQCNRIGVAQEHYCTASTQMIMSQFYPKIFSTERKGRRLVAACVGGDLHEIGIRMVTDFFEMDGWDTFYLGANVPVSGVLQQIAERTPHVLAISATLSSHLQAVADLLAAVRATANPPRLLVGGRPFNALPDLWKDIGADGCAGDAAEAVAVADGWSV